MKKQFNSMDVEFAMSRNTISQQNKVNKYLNWNLSVFPIEKNKKILDLGCGLGMYFAGIMDYLPSLYLAVDYSDRYISCLNTAFGGRYNCKTIKLDLTDSDAVMSLCKYKFDYIFLFDVLEHIEDDEKALKNIYALIRESGAGLLFLRVPALHFIYGKNDEVIGHYRRYSAKSLRSLLEKTFFDVKFVRYQNIIGIIPWYIIGKILKRSLAVTGAEGRVFNLLVPALKFLEKNIRLPVGLSLYSVCGIKG